MAFFGIRYTSWCPPVCFAPYPDQEVRTLRSGPGQQVAATGKSVDHQAQRRDAPAQPEDVDAQRPGTGPGPAPAPGQEALGRHALPEVGQEHYHQAGFERRKVDPAVPAVEHTESVEPGLCAAAVRRDFG